MSSAERQRRFRERVAAQKLAVLVEVDADIVELLIEAHLLPNADFHDRQQIANAILTFLALARRA